jgi:hypothetical protein
MKDEAATPRPASLSALLAAADGLLMPSESDYPFEPFVWDGPEPPTPERLLVVLGLPPGTPVETRTLERQFAPLMRKGEATDGAAGGPAGFAALKATFESQLAETLVYRVGEVEIQVFLLGVDAEGRWVGLRTTVVQT